MKIGQIPVPYHVVKYPNHKKNKKALMELIGSAEGHSVKDTYNVLTMTDLGMACNRTYMDKILHEEFSQLFKNFTTWWNLEQGLPDWSQLTYDFWYIQYEQGDYVKWHNHPLSTMSAVYYVDLPETKDVISFKSFDGEHVYRPEVKEGDVLFFPSTMPHSTICTSEKGKTSINFNLKAGFDDKYAQQVKNFQEDAEKKDDVTLETI